MEIEDIVLDGDAGYPILLLPKKCTKLETNTDLADNVYIDLNITSPDTDGNHMCIYSGFCCVKIFETSEMNAPKPSFPENNAPMDTDVDKMPMVLSEANQISFPVLNQSRVWIDPSRSPYVYNHYNATQEHYSIQEGPSCITVKQHNTYITKNVYNYTKKSNETSFSSFEHKKFRKTQEICSQSDNNFYDDDEFECGVFLSHLPEEIINEKRNKELERKNVATSGHNALKQLMSPNIQSVSKQRKTILYLGNNAYSGETIQNISYNDPFITCAEVEVDHEVVIDSSQEPLMKKKRYQCDKCKQIFDQIATFRQHMTGGHNTYGAKTPPKTLQDNGLQLTYECTECGRTFKSQHRFEIHCLSHGNPELECNKCHKVFASKATLKAHNKIHNRKYVCDYCNTTFNKLQDMRRHVEKIHSIFECEHKNCSFIGRLSDLIQHKKVHDENGNLPVENGILHVENEILQDENVILHEKSGVMEDENITLRYEEDALDDISGEDFCNKNDDDQIKQEKCDSDRNDDGSDKNIDYEKELVTDRIKNADMVIAKVMSNKIFLLNSDNAKKQRFHKACEVCYKTFDRIGDLKRHLIEHVIRSTLAKTPINIDGTLDIQCEVCQIEKFSKIDKYKAHLREHAKLTLYKCTFCDKSFSDSSNFSKHKKIHGNSYFQCDLCQRKFNSKKMISQHMELHIKNSPVKCRFCSKTFYFKSMLNKHVNCVHKLTASKYKCRFCEETVSALKDKWDHEWQVHNVRKIIVDCKLCGSKFRKYSQLKRHCLEIHGTEIPTLKKLSRKKKRFAIAAYVC